MSKKFLQQLWQLSVNLSEATEKESVNFEPGLYSLKSGDQSLEMSIETTDSTFLVGLYECDKGTHKIFGIAIDLNGHTLALDPIAEVTTADGIRFWVDAVLKENGTSYAA